MLLPRPETRTPTRTRSAMMGCRPVVPRRPGAARAGDGAALLAGDDVTDSQDAFSCLFKRKRDIFDIVSRDDQRHADPAIEGPRQLLRLDIALRLKEGHQPRLRPGIRIDAGV